ncbi:MAG: CBM96 family carbohydrate-binding protein [Promethearchaeota archaeon]
MQASSIVLYPIDDSFVDSGEPDRNRGDFRFLNSGKWVDQNREMKAYISFNISSVPSEWIEAKLSLTYWLSIKTVDVDIVEINENWNEDTITWNNMPAHGSTILTMTVNESSETTKLLDLSSHIKLDFIQQKEVFSICIYMPVNQGAIVGAISKEFVEYPSSKWPRLIFSFPSPATPSISFIPLWILLLSVALSMTGVALYFKKYRYQKWN